MTESYVDMVVDETIVKIKALTLNKIMKEDYIKMRNSNQLNVGLLYTLAKEEGLTAAPDQFSMALSFANINEMICHLDHKFELTIVYNKNGGFIKVVE